MNSIWERWPQWVGIVILQGGLSALGATLLRWEWWVVVTGSVIYACAAEGYGRARGPCNQPGTSK